jgi:hypothetical protein
MGYYCLAGTQYTLQYPCPAGTFNNKTLRESLADCELAPPGSYSQGSGNVNPTGQCSVGYYCPGGAVTSTPSCEGPAGTICSTGGRCAPGQVCGEGTSSPSGCPPGMYCADSSGVVTGLCASGYYCVQASTEKYPVSLYSSNTSVLSNGGGKVKE